MTIALNSAISGLKVAQQALDTASKNISNASTPGYTRKTLPQENLLIAGQGSGARGLAITRYVDNSLIADLDKQVSITESYNIRLKYLDRIQDFQGSSDSGRAISAQVTALSSAFTDLSTAPGDPLMLSRVVSTAMQTTGRINDFSNLLTGMRNDTETDISSAVSDINQALENIANLNAQISKYAHQEQSTADLEDQRDLAIKTVAKYIDITTFPADKSVSVITRQGQILADDTAHKLYFQKSTILPTSYYPGGGMNGLAIDSPGGTDITQSNLGGQLGALFELRDETLPQYGAQLDEFAQKMAERFNSEGLKLFTDISGNVPASVADPGAVPYVGFASLIRVNNAVIADPALIRNGTNGNTELSGSNEVIRRIAQFAFGPYQYQQAKGDVDISAAAPPLTTMLGLATRNSVVGTANIASYSPDLSSVPGLTLPSGFKLTIGATGPLNINILATDSAADVVNTINAAFGSAVASINNAGQLNISSSSAITIADNTIGAPGMAALGFNFGTTQPPNPDFQVQVGTRAPATISIAPADTSVQLLAKLNAVPGLTAALDGAGKLVITPTDGGDIKITDGAGTPLNAMGMTVTNIAHTSFRQNNLGPDPVNNPVSTGLVGNGTLQDYISSIISTQSEEHNINKTNQAQEMSFLQTLETRNDNTSGVNIDQEMADLIRIQSAYSAAARMVSATEKIFDDLLNAFR